jgi:hypothetical protein
LLRSVENERCRLLVEFSWDGTELEKRQEREEK